MAQLPSDANDRQIIAFADRWASMLELGSYDDAFHLTAHDPHMGWTPELMRFVITNYGEAAPGQRVTLVGKPTDISQRKEMSWFNGQMLSGELWYDLNINGSASDLTATFAIERSDNGVTVALTDIHVM